METSEAGQFIEQALLAPFQRESPKFESLRRLMGRIDFAQQPATVGFLHHGEIGHEHLRDFIVVQRLDRMLQLQQMFLFGFDGAAPFLPDFDFSIPTVDAFDGAIDLDAGRQTPFDEGSRQGLRLLFIIARGRNLNNAQHAVPFRIMGQRSGDP